MENKGIMIYLSMESKYEQLTKDEWYDLSFAAMKYAKTGEKTDFNDRFLKSLFNDWCKSIDADYAKYEKKKADTAERVKKYRESKKDKDYNIEELDSKFSAFTGLLGVPIKEIFKNKELRDFAAKTEDGSEEFMSQFKFWWMAKNNEN